MDYKVAICMSTYNGKKYIEKQIESLLNQTYSNIQIYIRDDGSTDGTTQILEEYEKQGKINLIKGENLGFVKSFYYCLKEAYNNAELFAYCDQDDKWHKDKVERAVNKIKEVNDNIPILYFSEFNYCDENLNFVRKSNMNKRGPSFRNSILECITAGISEVFNKKLAYEILESGPDDVCFHDWWAYMIASGLGKVIYDMDATVNYRRLDTSVSPSGKKGIKLQIYRIKKFLFSNYFIDIKRQINKYKSNFKNRLDNKEKRVLDLFTLKYDFIKSMKKVFYYKMFRQKLTDEIMCRILFLFGKL